MTQTSKRLPASLWHRLGRLSLAWAGGLRRLAVSQARGASGPRVRPPRRRIP
jgi:hypothetical protein